MDVEPRGEQDRVRVSDREREQVVEILGQAVAEGRLTLNEYEERAGAAHGAQTRGELVGLTQDLPMTLPAQRPPSTMAGPAQERLVAVFGNESRKGHWVVPAHLATFSIFGDCHIELQEAQLTAPVTVIETTAVFGSATIYVPDGLDVRLSGPAVFGSKDSKLRGTPPPGAPVIEVRVRVLFGAVSVRTSKRKPY